MLFWCHSLHLGTQWLVELQNNIRMNSGCALFSSAFFVEDNLVEISLAALDCFWHCRGSFHKYSYPSIVTYEMRRRHFLESKTRSPHKKERVFMLLLIVLCLLLCLLTCLFQLAICWLVYCFSVTAVASLLTYAILKFDLCDVDNIAQVNLKALGS